MSQQSYNYKIEILILTLNAISASTIILILFIYLFSWKKINTYPMRMILYLCIASLLQNIYALLVIPLALTNYMIEPNIKNGLCDFEAAIKTAFDLSSLLWTFFIMLSAYISISSNKIVQRLEIYFLIGGFFIPVIISSIPIPLNLYGSSGYYCWFRTQNHTLQFWLKMGFYYIPLWCVFIINSYLAIKTYIFLNKLNIPKQQLNNFQRVLIYPIILFICGIFSTVKQIYAIITQNHNVIWLNILNYAFYSLYGFFNALVLIPIIQGIWIQFSIQKTFK